MFVARSSGSHSFRAIGLKGSPHQNRLFINLYGQSRDEVKKMIPVNGIRVEVEFQTTVGAGGQAQTEIGCFARQCRFVFLARRL